MKMPLKYTRTHYKMSVKAKYKGVMVPMVSPFNDDLSVDIVGVKTIITSFLDNDIIPFVLGTTGEAPSLSFDQKITLIKAAKRATKNEKPLMAGIGNNSLFASIEEGKRFAGLGVEALVATVPNYYPSDSASMMRWFEMLADQLPVPLFMYNIPATTHHSIPLSVANKLSYHENIAGMKDSERDEDRLNGSLKLWADREDFVFLVGWAAKSAYGLKRGANGIVPSVGNLIPGLFNQLYLEAIKGNDTAADELQILTDRIAAYCQKGRNISQSIPAMKVLMEMEGICGTQVLPPMMRMDYEEERKYRNEMQHVISNLKVTK